MMTIIQAQQAQYQAIQRLYLNTWRKAFGLSPLSYVAKSADKPAKSTVSVFPGKWCGVLEQSKSDISG